MIEKMHDKSNSLAFKIIFALVSVSFVLGGIGTGFLRADTSAVNVNGEEISQYAFSQAKNRQQNAMNAQLGERFWDLLDNPEYNKQFNQSILNGLIEDELLRQYAKQLKLGVSVEQIKSEIVNSPNFQTDGKFDNRLYQQLLRNSNMSADQYASLVYESVLFSQLQEGIVDSYFTVPVQQEQLAKWLLQKRSVRLATHSLAKETEDQVASNEELQAYYDAHKTAFINPEKLTVEYVRITPKDLEPRIQITPEQIDTYYQTNRAQFITQGEAKIAHIQVADENTANEIAQQLKAGADFAALAKEKSADKLSAVQGGELGWAKAGTFPQAFEEALNGLQAGQVSQPVKVDSAFHIIKVLERKPENVVPVENVKEQIANIIRQELVATEYSAVTREMANKAFESSGSLESVAQLGEVKVEKTDAFSRDNVPVVLNHDKVLKVLFNGELRQNGQNSDAIDLTNGNHAETMFVRVSDYKAQSNQTFDEAKTTVELAVKREKAENALLAKAEEQVKALQEGNAQAVSFAPEQTLVFADAQITHPVLAKTIFAMAKPTDKAAYQVARNAEGDVIIVGLDKVEDGKVEDFKPLEAQFNQADRLVLRYNLVQDLRERAKIEFNEDFIQQINTLDNK
ncbi:peptidylprolyl isomerase [Pasteurellaceae bacterium Orientalotternb1]|nr:peptidylprolyl isomerase [Pasteurellaceae bacterium Orientalotternb1]